MKKIGFFRLKKAVENANTAINNYTKTPYVQRSKIDRSRQVEILSRTLESISDDDAKELIRDQIASINEAILRDARTPRPRRAPIDKDDRSGKELLPQLQAKLNALLATLTEMEAAHETWTQNDYAGTAISR